MLKRIILFTVITQALSVLSTSSFAQEIQNTTEYLDIGDVTVEFDMSSDTVTSPTSENTNSYEVPKEAPSEFSLTLKETTIDYGELIPANPLSRTMTLLVRNVTAPFYKVLTYEDHPPRDSIGNTIPDTTCDNGSCTETRSAPWTSPLVYGFGYRCNDMVDDDCDTVFDSESAFEQFADQEQNEKYGTILSGSQNQTTKENAVIFRINTAASQPKGNYHNTVSYILVPAL